MTLDETSCVKTVEPKKQKLYSLAVAIKKLAVQLERGEDFPNESPVLMAELVRGVVTVISGHLDHAPEKSFDYVSKILKDLPICLELVEQSRLTYTPWSMIESIESLLRKCTGEHTSFIIRPRWEYNFSITNNNLCISFKDICKELANQMNVPGNAEAVENVAMKTANRDLRVIWFPRVERRNVLLHTAFGHEVGHIVANDMVDREVNRIWDAKKQAIDDKFLDILVEASSDTNEEPLDKYVKIKEQVSIDLKICEGLFRKGVEELIADYVCVHLFGFAALNSLLEVASVVTSNMDENPLENENYPPWRFRIKQAYDQVKTDFKNLTENGFFKGYAKRLQSRASEIAEADTSAIWKKNHIVHEAYGLIEAEIEGIKEKACEVMSERGRSPYRISDNCEIVKHLIQRLEKDIPPNETGTWPNTNPARLEDILNAGWAYRMTRPKRTLEETYKEDELVNSLVLKAIESSYVHEKYGAKLKEMRS